MSMTNDEMDRLIDEHFAYEAADDVDGVMSTLTAGQAGAAHVGEAQKRCWSLYVVSSRSMEIIVKPD